MRFRMDTQSGRRLQLQECVNDIAMAVEDGDEDTLEHGYLLRALTCLETAVALMKARGTADTALDAFPAPEEWTA